MKNSFGAFRGVVLVLLSLVVWSNIAAAANFQLTVSVPATTPEGEPVCITGNADQLGQWDGKGAPLKEIGPNLFIFSADMPAAGEIEFKFTRGSFASVEKTAQGLEQPNRRIVIKPGQQINQRLHVEAWADQISQQPAGKPQITGNYRVIRALKSKFLSPARDIIVWLPPSYNSQAGKSLRYPVVYMHDGRNLFDPGTSFGGVDWGVDEAMTTGCQEGRLQEAIVVGIDNTADRMSEYTPFPDPEHKGGNGESYVRFLVEELKPLIDREFRSLPDRSNTFIGGSSLGGLISLYAGISRPQVFSGVIAMSPSIWWADGAVIKWLIENRISDFQGRIWIDMGTREGEEAVSFCRRLAETVKEQAAGFKGLHYREFSGGTHSEGSWRQRMHLPLRFFLGTRN